VPAARHPVDDTAPRVGSPAPPSDDSVHLGRQPVFDADLTVVGYELLFRSAGSTTAQISDPEQATADVVVKTFTDFGLETVVGSKLAFVNLPRGFLTGSKPLPFPPQGVVLEVLEDVVADRPVLEGMRALRAAGYRFALDDFVWSDATEPLIELCDYVKIDVLASSPAEVTDLARRLRPFDVHLLAEKVETEEQFQLCRSLSFELFQGFLLSRPTVLTRRSLDSTRLACLRLLSVLASDDFDVADAEAAIRSDPGLTFRILRTVNSASSGLRRTISSVREAVILLGPRALIGWVLLMSMSGADTGTAAAVNVDVALTRARMCELLAPQAAVSPDIAFTAGLVSSLDLLLAMPLEEAVADLPLDADLCAAVLEHRGAMGALLADVLAYESSSELQLLTIGQARPAYLAALTWTRSVLARAEG
jgi:c-di-GMP phosphodiesterase